jgi:hypothetical protein
MHTGKLCQGNHVHALLSQIKQLESINSCPPLVHHPVVVLQAGQLRRWQHRDWYTKPSPQ